MANWALVNLNHGELDGHRILSEESYDELWTPTVEADDRAVGLSWFVSEHRGRTRIGHGGSDTGFRSHFAILPDEGLGLIVASNYSGTPMGALADGILDVLLGYAPTVPKRSGYWQVGPAESLQELKDMGFNLRGAPAAQQTAWRLRSRFP